MDATYLWQDGSTDTDFTITESGIYWVESTDSLCSHRDSIYITFDSLDIDLPREEVLCPEETLLLNIAQEGVTHLWIDSTRNPAFFITESGTYWVESSKGACTLRDSITVSFAEQQSFLPNDTTICDATTFVIRPQPSPTYILFWEGTITGDLMEDSLLVDSNGVYHAFILDDKCEWLDSVEVNFVSSKEVELGKDTMLCEGEMLTLEAPPTISNFQWQDGTNTFLQLISQSGLYWLAGTIDNCPVRDSIQVTVAPCKPPELCQAYLPNSFSPNGDGINDELQLLTDCELQFFEMEVYDRWGSLLFSTTDVRQSWDGQYRGELLEAGVYLWVVRYQLWSKLFGWRRWRK